MGPEVVDYDDEIAFAALDDGDDFDFNDAIEDMIALGYTLGDDDGSVP